MTKLNSNLFAPVHICFVHTVRADCILDTPRLSRMYPPLNTACISRGSACHVFSAIHHNRSCHSWLQRASCAFPTVHIVQTCASICKPVQASARPCKPVHCPLCTLCKPVHLSLCTLCKQPGNKYLGSIQVPHH